MLNNLPPSSNHECLSNMDVKLSEFSEKTLSLENSQVCNSLQRCDTTHLPNVVSETSTQLHLQKEIICTVS